MVLPVVPLSASTVGSRCAHLNGSLEVCRVTVKDEKGQKENTDTSTAITLTFGIHIFKQSPKQIRTSILPPHKMKSLNLLTYCESHSFPIIPVII